MSSSLPVTNPRTGQVDHHLHPPEQTTLKRYAHDLRQAQQEWQALGFDGRAKVLQTWSGRIRNNEALLSALFADTGRWNESRLEVQGAVSLIERIRNHTDVVSAPPPQPSALPFIEKHSTWGPYPLVGVLSPWNFPLLLGLIDTAAALMAGCAVLVKPSEITPRFIAPLQATWDALDAPSVLRIIEGAGPTGTALVDQVDLVCLTGSVATGKKVATQCSQRMIPSYLELGGKDPAIVTATANLNDAARALLWGSVVNAGQSCLSIERIFVETAVAEAFTQRLVTCAQAVGLAYPDPKSSGLGPIIAPRQVEIIEAHLEDAFQRGAIALTGGQIERLGGGVYLRPTVLTRVTPDMRIMREETFGPIMPIMSVPTTDEAIRHANDTEFGLSAAVFAEDLNKARAIAERLEAGAVSINDAGLTAFVHDADKSAFKASGLGPSRMGQSAVVRFLRPRAFLTRRSPDPDPWWFD